MFLQSPDRAFCALHFLQNLGNNEKKGITTDFENDWKGWRKRRRKHAGTLNPVDF